MVILILKIYKCFKMDHVVKEINGLEIVKKRKKHDLYEIKDICMYYYDINIVG